MSGTQLAALIAALAFLLLVGVLLVPILRLRATVDAATRALTDLADGTGPLLAEAHRTLDGVNAAVGQLHTSLDGVNTQLERLDVITENAQRVSGNAAELSTIVAGVTANPLIKAASLGYGVRKGMVARRQPAVPAAGRRSGARTRRSGVLLGRVARHGRKAATVVKGSRAGKGRV